MTKSETFVREVSVCATSALCRPQTRRELFSIGRVSFELAAPGGTGDEWLGRAFLPVIPDRAIKTSALHRLSAWDGTEPSNIPPDRPWGESGHEPLGVVKAYTNESVRCAFDVHTSCLIVSDFRNDTSFIWYPNIDALPAWAKASPFRIPLSWLLNRNGMQIIHGAAVSVDDKAVLLAGGGGSGKSTTALACALAGMGYLGDDYCAIEPSARMVHMIYRTAKVLPASLALLPDLQPWLVNRDRIEVEKGVMFLSPDHVELVPSAEISAILLPRLGAEGRARITPATRAEAISAILPSTIGGLMGGTAYTPKAILQLVHHVPAFHIDLGERIDSIPSAVASFLTGM